MIFRPVENFVRVTAGLRWALAAVIAPVGLALVSTPASSAPGDSRGAPVRPRFADLVDLIEPAPLVLVVQVRKVVQVEPQRARNVPSGQARIYVEARPVAVLRGRILAAETISYLADEPLDAHGKLPALGKRNMMLVARPVPGHPEMMQLVAPDAQLPWDSALETQVRAVLAALQAPDAPSRVTGVREAIHVPGALVGEGETQIFLATADGSPAAITVVDQPGQSPKWSVSFSEVVDRAGQPPAHDTLAWYRLACFLPRDLPTAGNVSATAEDRARAVADYALVIAGLGPCGRTRL